MRKGIDPGSDDAWVLPVQGLSRNICLKNKWQDEHFHVIFVYIRYKTNNNIFDMEQEMRNQYSEYSDDIAWLREDAMNCKLLILDDIGEERPIDYVCDR